MSAAILFAWLTFTSGNPTDVLVRSANRIGNGDVYRPEVMARLEQAASDIDESGCQEAVLVAAATIKARRAEDLIGLGDLQSVDLALRELSATAKRLVTCSPHNGYGWLLLFWSTNLIDGFSSQNTNLLKASYEFAPREGWVAVRRAPLAFSVFSALPADLQKKVVAELISIVNAGLLDQAISIMTGPAAKYLDRITPELSRTPLALRSQLSKRLYQAGYDLDIPGVSRQQFRPWR